MPVRALLVLVALASTAHARPDRVSGLALSADLHFAATGEVTDTPFYETQDPSTTAPLDTGETAMSLVAEAYLRSHAMVVGAGAVLELPAAYPLGARLRLGLDFDWGGVDVTGALGFGFYRWGGGPFVHLGEAWSISARIGRAAGLTSGEAITGPKTEVDRVDVSLGARVAF